MGIKVVPEESAGLNPHIPEKVYVGRLAGITERVLEVKKEGNPPTVEQVPRFELTFGVRAVNPEGKPADIRMTALTSPKATTKSKLWGWIKALQGGVAAELGKELDLDSLVGKYGNLVVKDKQRKDRQGNIQVTSEISDIMPIDVAPTPEISIEGLVIEEEDDETPPAAPAAPAAEPVKIKTKKK